MRWAKARKEVGAVWGGGTGLGRYVCTFDDGESRWLVWKGQRIGRVGWTRVMMIMIWYQMDRC